MRRASIVAVMLSIGVLFAAGIGSVVVAASACTMDGSAGGDLIIGTSGRDVICANGGNDWIDPRGGNDLVIAGPGDDFVRGSAGADVVKGGLGKDYLVGGPGPDHLFGADGADRCLNTRDNIAGNDSASGGPGFDTGTRNPGDTFVGIERTTTVAPYCPPAPPRPSS
jgi:hypothetical protein